MTRAIEYNWSWKPDPIAKAAIGRFEKKLERARKSARARYGGGSNGQEGKDIDRQARRSDP